MAKLLSQGDDTARWAEAHVKMGRIASAMREVCPPEYHDISRRNFGHGVGQAVAAVRRGLAVIGGGLADDSEFDLLADGRRRRQRKPRRRQLGRVSPVSSEPVDVGFTRETPRWRVSSPENGVYQGFRRAWWIPGTSGVFGRMRLLRGKSVAARDSESSALIAELLGPDPSIRAWQCKMSLETTGVARRLRQCPTDGEASEPVSHAIVVLYKYVPAIPCGMLLADDVAAGQIGGALRIAEESVDDMALGSVRLAMGIALVHRESAEDRRRELQVLEQVREMCMQGRFWSIELAIIEVYMAGEIARSGDFDGAVGRLHGALDDLFSRSALSWRDVSEAKAVIKRLAAAPTGDGLAMRDTASTPRSNSVSARTPVAVTPHSTPDHFKLILRLR